MRKPVSKKAATKAKAKPADVDQVTARRAKAYSDMESYVCDLARAGTLAMVVHDRDDLFLFAVDQFDNMAQRFRQLYYAEEFPPE